MGDRAGARGRGGGMNRLRDRVRLAVEHRKLDELEALVKSEARALRYLVGMTYREEAEIRDTAATAVGLAARHQPKLLKSVIERLISAMDNESGNNGASASIVILAIAREKPELLLGAVPDLVRLAGDESVHDELAEALTLIRQRCPGQLAERLGRDLEEIWAQE